MNDVIQAPPHLNVQISCVRSENSFKQNQKPYRKYVFELSASTGHRWEIGFRYSELQSLYDHIVKQFPKHKLSPFPPKVNPFKPEIAVIQERQTSFDTITKEMLSYQDICDCFQLQHFFQIKKHIYGDSAQGINQGMLWIKIIEAVGLELEENPKTELSPQLKMRVSVPLNHCFHPPTLATQVFNNNKHAKWFEEFSMSVPNKEFPVQFKVWNHRTLASNQLLGRFELDIRPFASNQVHDLWLQISKTARLHVMFQFSESTLPSEPKNHINLKLPDLRLVLERTVYMPGETVTGSVLYNVGNPLSLKHITLQLYGAEHAEWTESHTESSTDSDGSTRSETVYETYAQTRTLFNVDQILFAEKPIIDSGSYYWPFSFVLPTYLPPSMKYDRSYIAYHAAVTVHRPGLASNKQVKAKFDVAVNYVSMYSTPAITHKEKKLNFRSKDQVVAITGVLDQNTNVVTMGSTRVLSLTIDNRSEYDVKKMYIRLVAHGRRYAQGRSDAFNSHASFSIDEDTQSKLPKGRSVFQTQIQIVFPVNNLPSLFHEFTPLIHIENYLEIECTMTGFLTGCVSTVIPIIFNKMPPPSLVHVPAFEPSAPKMEPVLSYQFQPNGVTPLPPMDPALFEQQYGVNYQSLNQAAGSTPQYD